MENEGAADWEGLSDKDKMTRLIEANVRKGVQTLKENAEVIDGMSQWGVVVHGLVYDIASGELRELEIEEQQGEAEKRVEAFQTA